MDYMPFELGDIVDQKYLILELLGEGGFGSTYLTESVLTKQRFVVKISHLQYGVAHGPRLGSLEREAELVATLDHPQIARVLDFGAMRDGRVYIVYPYHPGTTLDRVLAEQGRLPPSLALPIMLCVARAVEYLHRHKIVHRDLKPSNILLTESPDGAYSNAILIDLGGAARLVRDTGLTMTGEMYGSLAYSAPEQFRAEGHYLASDVYSFGVVLYEILTGERLFPGQTVFDVHLAKSRSILPEHSDWGMIEPIWRLVQECTRLNPGERPPIELVLTVLRDLELGVGRSKGAKDPVAGLNPASQQVSSRPRNESSSKRLPRTWARGAIGATIGSSAALLLVLSSVDFFSHSSIIWMWSGFALAVGGVGVRWAAKSLAARNRDLGGARLAELMTKSSSRDSLTQSVALELEELVSTCRKFDERIIARTIASMFSEYETAKASGDRQAALMNAISLMDRLMVRLSPWYVRYEKPIAVVATLTGIVGGIIAAAKALSEM